MYYHITEETFQSLDKDTQEKVLKDTEAYESGEKEEKEPEEEMEMEDKVDEMNKKSMRDKMAEDEEVNKIKDFDEADKKHMAIIIGIGGKKKGM